MNRKREQKKLRADNIRYIKPDSSIRGSNEFLSLEILRHEDQFGPLSHLVRKGYRVVPNQSQPIKEETRELWYCSPGPPWWNHRKFRVPILQWNPGPSRGFQTSSETHPLGGLHYLSKKPLRLPKCGEFGGALLQKPLLASQGELRLLAPCIHPTYS